MELDSSERVNSEGLFDAIESGDFGTVKSLLSESSTTFRNDDGRSVLHVAVSSGNPEVFVYFTLQKYSILLSGVVAVQIVSLVCDVSGSKSLLNASDEEGWAPIHSAASIGNLHIVAVLLEAGADVNMQNSGGRTALHYAASKGWTNIAEILIARGADINSKDKVGCTPLHRGASTAKAEMCVLLIEEGAEIDSIDKLGQTPLAHAVLCHNKEVALLLIRHGADVNHKGRDGYTVLGRASLDLRPALIDTATAMLES